VAHLYYSDDLGGASPGREVALVGPEARHASTVSRARRGERLQLSDGRGLLVHAVVLEAGRDSVVLQVEDVTTQPPPTPRIVLAQALAKGDRAERAVQAATELGVDAIVPWQAARSVSRWEGKKSVAGPERWRAIVREAGKQSLRPRLPDVGELHSSRDVAELAARHALLVLDPDAERRLSGIEPDERDLVLVVGPEGGFDDAELAAFEAAGAERVRLGETVLRTSTAGPAAIALVSALLGRW